MCNILYANHHNNVSWFLLFKTALLRRYIALFLQMISLASCSHEVFSVWERPLLSKAISILSTHYASWIKFIKAEAGFLWVSFIAVTSITILLGKRLYNPSLSLEVHFFSGWCVTSLMINLHFISVVILFILSVWFALLGSLIGDFLQQQLLQVFWIKRLMISHCC